MKRLGWVPVFIIGVPVLGVGIPLGWVWIASQLQGGFGGLGLLPLLVLVLGIGGTYFLVTLVANALSPRERGPRHRATSWNQSLSGERRRPTSATPIETLFIVTCVVVAAGVEIVVLLFGHPGVPKGP